MDSILIKIDEYLNIKSDYNKTSEQLINLYYEIGKYLYYHENDFKYKTIYVLEEKLRNKYGLVIGFTKRNLINMLNFYKSYNLDIKLLSKVEWSKHLLIMKQENKEELLNYCIKYNITNNNLRRIIKDGFNEKYTSKDKLKEDSMTLEFISLKQ